VKGMYKKEFEHITFKTITEEEKQQFKDISVFKNNVASYKDVKIFLDRRANETARNTAIEFSKMFNVRD
jgi:hypothetical protein